MAEPAHALPLMVEPEEGGVDPVAWLDERSDWLEQQLLDVGAVLLRGFPISSPDAFEDVVRAVSGQPLEYKERSSPRTQVHGNVYTSTEYPAAYPIHLHNENAYSTKWPRKLFFRCDVPPGGGGATPIGSMRRITEQIDPEVRREFAERQVMYVRNYRPDMGLDWTTVFGTTDKAEVEEHCRAVGMDWEWGEGTLRTRHVRPAFQPHPATGEVVWFNHVVAFHVTTLEPPVHDALLAAYAAEDLPNNSYFGDGAPIPDETLDHLRDVYAANKVEFPWQQDDVLVIDNMLVCHGRAPYTGERRILVAMGELTSATR